MEQYYPIESLLQNEIKSLSDYLNYETDLEELLAILYSFLEEATKENNQEKIKIAIDKLINFSKLCSKRYLEKRNIEAEHMPFSYYANKPKSLPSAILFID